MINNYKEIINYFSKNYLKDDFTELWVIVNKIYDENPKMNFSEIIKTTLVILDDLITNHHVKLLNEKNLKPYNLDKSQILQEVEKHLKKLNRIPTIGDGIWLTINNNS